MCQFARQAPSTSVEVIQVEPPFSNFSFVEETFTHQLVWPIRRVLSQTRTLGAKTMVLERLDSASAEDLREEQEDLRSHFGSDVASRVWRLSFFAKAFAKEGDLEHVDGDQFLGYAILKEDKRDGLGATHSIYESVVRPSRRENNFIRGSQRWECRVGSRPFSISGYLYAQQNGTTNSCAHVACRTAVARFHPDGDMTYRQMNRVAGVDPAKGGDGLTTTQMVQILESAGARCIDADYTDADYTTAASGRPPSFQRYVYGSVESGYPALLCFGMEHDSFHAIPIFGHTFNEDMWVPRAEWCYFHVGPSTIYLPSDHWLSTFIGHDDNFGSNLCVPRHFLTEKRFCADSPKRDHHCQQQSSFVAHVIATLPRDAKVTPIEAEVLGAEYVIRMLPQLAELGNEWCSRLVRHADENLLVFRPLLLTCDQYADHLARLRDWYDGSIRQSFIEVLRSRAGNRWMVEVSVPELFSANRRKLGEVLVSADIPMGKKPDPREYIIARVPGHFALCANWEANDRPFDFFQCGIDGHVALYGCEE